MVAAGYEPGVVAELDALVGLGREARDTSLLPRQPKSSLLAGRRSSKLRGRGLDFEELRAYVPGDDVRTIDWRVTARAGKPYVRSYREERDRSVLLLIDQRPSMFFGSAGKMKSVVAAEFGALIAHRVVAQGDRVGALLMGEGRTWAFKPARSHSHVQRICEGLVESTTALLDERKAPADDLLDGLVAAQRLASHDALVVVISDFRELSDAATEAARAIREHNDLLLAWVTDPLERALPDLGSVHVSDGRRELQVPSGDAALRASFAAEYRAEQARFLGFAQGASASGFELLAERSVVEQLREVLGRARLGGARR